MYLRGYPSNTGCSFMICRWIRTLAAAAHERFSEQRKGFHNMAHLYMEISRFCTTWDVRKTESSQWFLSSSVAGTSTEDAVLDTPTH
jgi:hypothetical protein